MQSASVWVAGEALIDLLPSGLPVVGGGPANTSKTLSNLGVSNSFVGCVSTDHYGALIRNELSEYSVDTSFVNVSLLPTAIAKATLDDSGSASYEFSFLNTATFDFADWLPSGNPKILYLGSLASVVEPGATYLYEWVKRLNTQIIYDPNIRPQVLDDRRKYREYFEKWARISKIIKLSEDDLNFLGYELEEILDFGVELVVLTRGLHGIIGLRRSERIEVSAVQVSVIDTVGAGDTVGAVLVEGLLNYGELSGEVLERVLRRSAIAAAIACTREGARPPTVAELTNFC